MEIKLKNGNIVIVATLANGKKSIVVRNSRGMLLGVAYCEYIRDEWDMNELAVKIETECAEKWRNGDYSRLNLTY